MRRRWWSCCHALAVGAVALFVALSPAVAGAADAEAPPGRLQVIQIGSQVVAVDAVGNAVLYSYPPGEAPVCGGAAACLGFSAGAAGVVVFEGGDVAVDVASGSVFVEERAAPP